MRDTADRHAMHEGAPVSQDTSLTSLSPSLQIVHVEVYYSYI